MDYKYIRAWGKMLGSFRGYIEGEIEKARKESAPETAIYRRSDGTWATFEGIECQDTKQRIREIIGDMTEVR